MLHQPRRWLPGLLPLALLAGGSLWWKQDAIEADLAARDERDRNRVTAPLEQAKDAVLLDTTRLDAAQAIAEAIRLAEAKR